MHHALRLLRDQSRRCSLLHPAASSSASTTTTTTKAAATTSSAAATTSIQAATASSQQAEATESNSTHIAIGQRVPLLPRPSQPLPSGSGSASLQQAAAVLRPPPAASMTEHAERGSALEGRAGKAAVRSEDGRGAEGRIANQRNSNTATATASKRPLHPQMQADLDAGLSLAQARLLQKLRATLSANPAYTPAQLTQAHDAVWAKYAAHNVRKKQVRHSVESWSVLLKYAERKNDAKSLTALGTRALAWARAESANEDEARRVATLVANLQLRYTARTGYVFAQRTAPNVGWAKDDFGRAAQLRSRLPCPPLPRASPTTSSGSATLGKEEEHEVFATQETQDVAWSARSSPRPLWPRTHVASSTSTRTRLALHEALAARRAERSLAEARRKIGLLPPSTLSSANDSLTHGELDWPVQPVESAESKLRAWEAEVGAREDMRAKVQEEVIERLTRGSAGETLEASVPPTWLLLAALRARAERGESQKAHEMVQAYLRALLAQAKPSYAVGKLSRSTEERREALLAALHNGAHTKAVSQPDVPPRAASLLNLVVRAHVCADQRDFSSALACVENLTGKQLAFDTSEEEAPTPRREEVATPPAVPLVPDEQTLLLLLSLLRHKASRLAKGLALCERLMHLWTPNTTSRGTLSEQRQLFLGTRTARVLLGWALERNDKASARRVLNRQKYWLVQMRAVQRGAEVRDAEPTTPELELGGKAEKEVWQSLLPRGDRSEKFKWARVLRKLYVRRWIDARHLRGLMY